MKKDTWKTPDGLNRRSFLAATAGATLLFVSNGFSSASWAAARTDPHTRTDRQRPGPTGSGHFCPGTHALSREGFVRPA